MSDPVTAVPDELRSLPTRSARAFELLRRHDFRNTYLAVAASELGDALHYIALMWFAFDASGPLGVVAVRLATASPRSSSDCMAASPPIAGIDGD